MMIFFLLPARNASAERAESWSANSKVQVEQRHMYFDADRNRRLRRLVNDFAGRAPSTAAIPKPEELYAAKQETED